MTNATALALRSDPVTTTPPESHLPPAASPAPSDGGNLAARNRLIEDHLHLVHAAAGRMKRSYGRYLTMDELVGYATEGLIDAAGRFDPTRGASFATFSFYRIQGAMLDGLRRSGWYSRYDVARFHAAKLRAEQRANELLEERLNDDAAPTAPSPEQNLRTIEDTLSQLATVHIISLDDVDVSRESSFLTDHSTPAPDQARDARDLKSRVQKAIATLPERERRLIELHYFADRDLPEVGAALGVPKWTTYRLHNRAVRLLRDALAGVEESL